MPCKTMLSVLSLPPEDPQARLDSKRYLAHAMACSASLSDTSLALRRLLCGLLLATLLCGTGCDSNAPATEASQPARADITPPRQVQVLAVVEEKAPRGIVVMGTLAAEAQVVLSLKMDGHLSELSVDLGSQVRQGQTLARLDPVAFRLQVQQAEAALQQARARLGLAPAGTSVHLNPEQTPVVQQARAMLQEARRNHDRATGMWTRQLIARANLETTATNLEVAEGRYHDALTEVQMRQALLAERQAALDLARQQLLDSVLKAPMDGAVRQRHASAGEYLEAGTPVVTIVRLHPLRLQLEVPERVASQVRQGQPVQVKVEGDAQEYPGTIVRLSPAINQTDRTLPIEAEVPNAHGRLRPGAFAEAEIVTHGDAQAIFVPTSALVTFAGLTKVFVVQESMSVEKRVQTGRRLGERVEIIEGLAPGELVVLEPGNLVGGQPVTVRR